jgi:urease accessory protein
MAMALPAMAHPGHGAGSRSCGRPAAPLTGLDHLLALLAVGLWSRQQRQRHGAAAGVPGADGPGRLLRGDAGGRHAAGAGDLDRRDRAAARGLAAAALRMPPQLAVALVGLCGFLHGLAHGRELAGMASGAGFLLASALLMGWGWRVAPGERRRRMARAAIGAAAPLPLLYLLAGVV